MGGYSFNKVYMGLKRSYRITLKSDFNSRIFVQVLNWGGVSGKDYNLNMGHSLNPLRDRKITASLRPTWSIASSEPTIDT